jgi:hypothetical protein
MNIFLKLGLILSLSVWTLSLIAQTNRSKLIIGSWRFEKFELSDGQGTFPPSEEKKANDANKGLIIKFTSDNKYSSVQKKGLPVNNSKGTYKMLPNDGILIMGSPAKIIQLDSTYLKIYRDEVSPIVVFKRL